jgi:hypothetical protein
MGPRNARWADTLPSLRPGQALSRKPCLDRARDARSRQTATQEAQVAKEVDIGDAARTWRDLKNASLIGFSDRRRRGR